MFSLFNSDLDPTNLQSMSQLALYAPRFINVTAGEPFTFTVALFGNKIPKQIVLNIPKTDGLTIEMDRTGDNLPTGGFSHYITIYNEVAGIYRPQL
jgi:hypothetical protein